MVHKKVKYIQIYKYICIYKVLYVRKGARYLFRRSQRYVPFVNLAISTTGLLFQTTIMYPRLQENRGYIKIYKDTH